MKRPPLFDPETYLALHSTPEPEILTRISRHTHLTQVYPQMLSGHLQGTFLRFLCMLLKPQEILEIGTFTGYSAVAMALGAPQARVHTIEANPELEEIILHHIHLAGLEERITLHMGDAPEIIPTLDQSWDLVFIDADKPNYLNYYRMVAGKMNPGGIILADNVLWDGKVLNDPEVMDRDTRAIHEFNQFVQQDPRVENLIIPLRDGLMVILGIGNE